MTKCMTASVVLLGLAAGLGARCSGQEETRLSAGCTLARDTYTCDKATFEQVLTAAKSAAIETGPTDAIAQQRLKALVTTLGKTLVPRAQPADLTFLLVPVDPAGVQYNTNVAHLAALRVYAATPGEAGRGRLVWAQNYTGDVDLQWVAIVNQLIAQFRNQFHVSQ